MRNLVFVAFLAVAFAAVFASPTASQSQNQAQVQTLAFEIKPNDWLSDLIGLITGRDVATLLETINEAINGQDILVKQAEAELKEILAKVGKEAQEEIQAVLNEALGEANQITTPILEKLGLVMPAIQGFVVNVKDNVRGHQSPFDVSDLIKIIIGMTLEELLTMIGKALIQLDGLILETVTRLETIAETSAKSAAAQIHAVIDNTLTEAAAIIKPVKDVLEQLLPLQKEIAQKKSENKVR